jgi:hypothetical protein
MASASEIMAMTSGRKSFQDYQMLEEEFRQRKQMNQLAMQQAAMNAQKTQKDIETGVASNDPAAVKEYMFYNALPEEQKKEFLTVKRAERTLNLGGQYGAYDPVSGAVDVIQGAGIAPSPAQQYDMDQKTREQRDQFNRGLDVKKQALDSINRLIGTVNDTAEERQRRINAVYRISGPIGSKIPVLFNEDAYNAQTDLEYLKNLNTTENLGLLKGVLSDTDIRILASVGSGELAGSDEKVISALGRMQKALGGEVSAGNSYQGPGVPLLSELGLGAPPMDADMFNAPLPETPTPFPANPQTLYQRAEEEFNAKKPKTVRWEDLP